MHTRILSGVLALIATSGFTLVSPVLAQTTGSHPGAVIQSAKPDAVPQNVKVPPLKLSDDQRDSIRKAVRDRHSLTGLSKKSTQAQKDFKPALGAKIPTGFTAEALPQSLLADIPTLKRYSYFKFNDQIMIVDPMTNKVVDVFPMG